MADISVEIAGRKIGPGHPTYIVAEMSANHAQSFEQAVQVVHSAKEVGADAVKLQTYTPDTMTIDADTRWFHIEEGTPWDDGTLYDLYREAAMPWEWQPKLKEVADSLAIDLFSSSFDATAVRFLDGMGVPVHKVASFELVDLPLIREMARSGKPMILSTGMSTLEEIDEAVRTARDAGARDIVLLHCVSSYPARPEAMRLRSIPRLQEVFGVPVGISDHTLGIGVSVAAVVLGACVVEKHLTISRDAGGPDSAFSLEVPEFRLLVRSIREAEEASADAREGPADDEKRNLNFRRSLFSVRDIAAGETLTEESVRVIRPGHGLKPKYLEEVLGRRAAREIPRGTPISWDLLA